MQLALQFSFPLSQKKNKKYIYPRKLTYCSSFSLPTSKFNLIFFFFFCVCIYMWASRFLYINKSLFLSKTAQLGEISRQSHPVLLLSIRRNNKDSVNKTHLTSRTEQKIDNRHKHFISIPNPTTSTLKTSSPARIKQRCYILTAATKTATTINQIIIQV